MARVAVDRAIDALWAFHERPSPTGVRWSDIDGCVRPEHYRAELERMPGNFMQACRAFLPTFEGLTHDEARAIASVIDMADALRLTPARPFRLPEPEGDSDPDTAQDQQWEPETVPGREFADCHSG